MHGVLDSADGWMVQHGNNSIPVRLLQEGYDVWLGNTRGNKYSRGHLFKDPESKGFWDFSVDELGLYDLPTLVDLPLGITHTEKLILICHSQSTSFYATAIGDAITRPKIVAKVSKAILLNPTWNLSEIQAYWVNWLGRLVGRMYTTLFYYWS